MTSFFKNRITFKSTQRAVYHCQCGETHFFTAIRPLELPHLFLDLPSWIIVTDCSLFHYFSSEKERSHKKTKDVCGHVSVTDTFNILLLPRDQLVWWYLCDARCSNKHRMLGQFYRSCYGDSLQTKHTHQEIHTQPHLKRDKFTKLTEEEYPLKQRLPSPSIFVHLQTSREALMSFTHPTVNEYMSWNYLFISALYFLLLISFNLTDPAHNKRFKLMKRFKTQRKKQNKQTGSFVLERRNLWGAYAAQQWTSSDPSVKPSCLTAQKDWRQHVKEKQSLCPRDKIKMLWVAFDLRRRDTDRLKTSEPNIEKCFINCEQAAIFNEDGGSYTSSVEDWLYLF